MAAFRSMVGFLLSLPTFSRDNNRNRYGQHIMHVASFVLRSAFVAAPARTELLGLAFDE
jgi:hypothetical protein